MGSKKVYDLGDKIRLTADWTVSGSAMDPTTPRCIVYSPTGGSTTYATTATGSVASGVTKSATGSFYLDLTLTTSSFFEGTYHYRWTGVGNAYAAGERSFEIRASKVV